jgi:hypothetical protein
LSLKIIVVLTWIRCLPLKRLQEVKEPCRYQRPEEWAEPVNPMIAREAAIDDIGTKSTGRIDPSTGVVDT